MGRVVSAGEPAWLPEDVDLALEWQSEQDLRHRPCGHPVDESTTREGENQYEARVLRCHACAEIARAREDFAGDHNGLLIIAERRDGGDGHG